MSESLAVLYGQREAVFFPETQEIEYQVGFCREADLEAGTVLKGMVMTPSEFVNLDGHENSVDWKTILKCKALSNETSPLTLKEWLEKQQLTKKESTPAPSGEADREAAVKVSTRSLPRKEVLELRMTSAMKSCVLGAAQGEPEIELPHNFRATRPNKKQRVTDYTRMTTQEFRKHVGRPGRYKTDSANRSPLKHVEPSGGMKRVEVQTIGYKRLKGEDTSEEVYLAKRMAVEAHSVYAQSAAPRMLCVAKGLTICGRTVYLHQLRQKVLEQGGCESVTWKRDWNAVAVTLGWRESDAEAGEKLRELYNAQLLHLESPSCVELKP